MGAGVSTEGAPLTRVKCKNNLGVLFDPAAEEKFYATATGPEGEETVPWPVADAYVKTRDERWRDPKHVLFQNLKQFKVARVEIEKIANEKIKGTIKEIPQRGQDVGDECQQRGLDGKPTASLDPLYEIAAMAREAYAEVMNGVCEGGPPLNLAPLKGRARAEVKAQNEYADKTAPCYSWLFDIVRGSVYCDHEDELVALWKKIEADPRIEIVRTKNRFNPPLFNGYRDMAPTLGNLGNAYGALGDPAKQRDMLERVLAIFERAYGRNHPHVATTLTNLGDAHVQLGDYAKARDVLERSLAIKELAYGHDHPEVGITLVSLGYAHIDLGDAAEACKFLQRALAIFEENIGPDHVYVAFPLRGLGNAHRDLGDAPKSLELLERSLTIFERHYGQENVEVAKTRWGLGKTHVVLDDVATARSHVERAVDIFEAKFGANHRDTSRCRETLASLS